MIKTLLDVDSAAHIRMDCATIVEWTSFGKHEFPACAGVDRATIEALPIQRGRGVRNAVLVGPDDGIAGMHGKGRRRKCVIVDGDGLRGGQRGRGAKQDRHGRGYDAFWEIHERFLLRIALYP